MKRIIALAASIAIAGMPIVVAPSANAAGTRCVSKAEYRHVKIGMAKKRVHAIFDTAGKQISAGYGYESREYKPCSDRRYGFVWVDYYHGKVESKYAYWG